MELHKSKLIFLKRKQKDAYNKTGHGIGSIKLMLQNIGATYGFVNFSKGNPMYARIANEYRNENLVFGKTMSEESFCKRFSIIE